MKRIINFLLVSTIVIFTACNSLTNSKTNGLNASKHTKIEKANWLIGKWQNISDEGYLQENWTKKNDSTFVGNSFFIVGNDTVSSESIVIEERGHDLFYIPTVKNQNDGKPIIFTLTSLLDSLLVFENPSHDFPQKITYSQLTADSLVATVSGLEKGKEILQNFHMTRAK